jgi:phage baseplate assembly protein V
MSRLNDQVMNMIARGVLAATDDSKGVQVVSLSLLADERKDNVERFQNYGFTSVPTGESEAIVIFPGGDRSAGVIVALDDRGSRMTGLAAGEVAVYTHEGDSIVLKINNEIEITTRRLVINAEETVEINAQQDVTITTPTRVLVTTPLLRVEGDIQATGSITEGAV